MSDNAWSCEEKSIDKCRQPYGCHCREITSQKTRITALEAEVTNLTKARAIDAGLMDGMKLVIKQLEAERDGARAAMAKEAADQCHLDKYNKTIDTFVFNGDTAKNRSGDTEFISLTEAHRIIGKMQAAILALANTKATP